MAEDSDRKNISNSPTENGGETVVKIPLLAQLVYGSYSEDRSKLVLSHDHGVGSPCEKCENCSGLDLHFWRKTCKNCGCKFEDHNTKLNESVHETIVYNLLNMTDDLSSIEFDSDDEELEKHPILKDFCKKKNSTTKDNEKSPVRLFPPPVSKKPSSAGTIKTSEQVNSSSDDDANVSKSPTRLLPPPVAKKPCKDGSRNSSNQVNTSTDNHGDKEMSEEQKRNQEIHLNEKRKQTQILMHQIPAQDFDPQYCHDLDEFEKNELKYFRLLVRDESIGKATTKFNNFQHEVKCAYCNQVIHEKEPYKFAERLPRKHWHPDCFKCHKCLNQLAGNIYFAYEDNIYCGRHYAENLKNRCAACDELIFAQKYTNAEDRSWHTKHFCCYKCDAALANKYYVVVENEPYCVTCYNNSVADCCTACLKPIEAGTERVNFETCNWHVNPKCFACTQCRKSLIDIPFIPSGEKMFCSQLCVGVYTI